MFEIKNPEPRHVHRLPKWVRLAWIGGREARLKKDRPDDWDIFRDMMMVHKIKLDHYGSATIQGQDCFVNEPYGPAEKALADMERLAGIVGGFAYVTKNSEHGNGTVRAILSPSKLEGFFLQTGSSR